MLFKRKQKEIKKLYTVPYSKGMIDNNLYHLISNNDFLLNNYTALLGADSNDMPLYCDIAKSPHILIAGATGSGKSVCINTMLLSLLFKNSPNTLELYFCDGKQVDFMDYEFLPFCKGYETSKAGIERLLDHIIYEMEYRYRLLKQYRVDNISKLPFLIPRKILVFDELASTKTARIIKQLEIITAKSRASGIHCIIGTQYPKISGSDASLSGTLKVNCDTRISFRVKTKSASRVIIDRNGAELLQDAGQGIFQFSSGLECNFNGYMFPDNQRRFLLDAWRVQPYSENNIPNIIQYIINQG